VKQSQLSISPSKIVWSQIRSEFSDSDIFNADETGLFYKLTPDQTLKFKKEKCTGGKMSNERVTVLVCANLDGSEKRKLLVMGKSKHPRCFKNIKHLPVKYTHNRKAWMTSDIFISEIRQWDNELKIRTIVLMDNSTAHPKMNNVKNIKLVFLPPNTTSMLQPLDQGIINNLKVNFAKCWSLN
jgi:hypothetical protein